MGSLDSLLMTGASAFTTETRLLDMVLPSNTAFDHVNAVAAKLEGSEYVSACYEYRLQFHCDSANLKLSDVIGLPLGITILQADGDKRAITGVIRKVKSLGSDGGWATYEATIVPFFALLSEKYSSRLISNKSVPEIAEMLLGNHSNGNGIASQSFKLDNQLTKTYGSRSTTFQYRESELHFVMRLLREEGISFYFTFSVDDDVPSHTMVLFDEGMNLEQCTANNIRFHRDDGTEEDDVITELHSTREIQSSCVTLSSSEYKSVTRPISSEASWITHGDSGDALAGTLEHYEPMGAYYGDSIDGNDLSRYAKIRQQAKDLKSKSFEIVSTVRDMGTAQWFTLDDHPELDASSQTTDRQFTVLEMHVKARNNLSAADQKNPDPVYQNTATVVRRTIPIVSEWTPEYAKPTARGMLTATVVGPANEVIYTDSLGRVKIVFPFQRDADGFTGFDDSNWVRVAFGTNADAGEGQLDLPRIGQEVLVGFIDGDIDRLIIVGSLFNGNKIPTRFSDASRLPADRALAGNKSAEHHGNGYSELVYDNTQKQISTYLHTTYAQTQLKMGWLGSERAEGKSTPKGEGFNLYSEAAGAIRSAKSLLLTAEPLKHGVGNQLHREILLKTLDAALMLAEQSGEQAKNQKANVPETGKDNKLVKDDAIPDKPAKQGHQTHLTEALHNLERGTNTDPQGKSGKGEQSGEQSMVAITAPDGIAIATPQSVTLATGTNLDQIAIRDTTQTTGRRWIHNVTESISLFVNGAATKITDTFKIIAGKGDINMQAQAGQILASSLKDFKITSAQGKVIVEAPNEIYLAAGGGYIRIGANIEIHNPGSQSQKAASFSLSGPASASAAPPSWNKPKLCDFRSSEATANGDAVVAVG